MRGTGEGFFEVTGTHIDPKCFLKLLKLAYQAAGDLTREQNFERTRRRRFYARSQLSSADLVDTRKALISLLAAENRKAMLLESDLPGAAWVIESAFVSNRPREMDVRPTIAIPAMIWGASHHVRRANSAGLLTCRDVRAGLGIGRRRLFAGPLKQVRNSRPLCAGFFV